MQRLRLWSALLVCAQALWGFGASGALHLPTFTAGTNTYTNVTVTAASGGRVVVDYGRGMASARVRDLDLDLQQQLVEGGLVNTMLAKEIEKDIAKRDAAKRRAERAASPIPSSLTLQSAETSSIAQLLSGQLAQRANEHNIEFNAEWFLRRFGQSLVAGASAALFVLGILRWFLFYRICRNATGNGSLLVFLPVLRWIPLAQAGEMSLKWLLVPVFAITAIFLPPPLVEKYAWAAMAYLGLIAALWFVTLILYMIWCVRLCRAVERSAFWALFLFFPVLDYIALLVLAFSDGKSDASSLASSSALKNPVLAI